MKRILTTKQETFCLKYVDLENNGTQAVLLAGYKCNASVARRIASENLTKPDIMARILAIRKRNEDASIASPKERRQRLTEIVRARLTDYQTSEGIMVNGDMPNTGAIESLEVTTRVSRDSHAGGITIKRPVVPEALRNEVFDRDGNKCALCNSTENLQIDHKIPLSKGGKTVKDNLQTLCELCNKRKGSSKKSEEEVITKLKLHSPTQAIDLLNKMDKLYSEVPAGYQDNRVINIIVSSEKAKQLTEGIGKYLLPEEGTKETEG